MGLLGIVAGLGLLVWLSFRGWSVLLLAPLGALVAAAMSGQPLLAHWTQTFMAAAAGFVAQYFPLFLLGACFGRLMEDCGAIQTIARWISAILGPRHAVLAVVLAGALLTYGGVSLFVAFFVLVPMAQQLFRAASVAPRLMPGAIALGTFTFTMTALPGTPAIQNTIPMPVFGTTAFAAPGLGLIAAAIMLGTGLWWLTRGQRLSPGDAVAGDDSGTVSPAQPRDPSSAGMPAAIAPMALVIATNLFCSLWLLPRLDVSYLAQARFGAVSLGQVIGVWSVLLALLAGMATLLLLHRRPMAALRQSLNEGAQAAVLPALSVASLVGFGAVVAALPAFESVRDWVLGIQGGPLVSLAVSTNLLASLTGSASGGLTIALDALGPTYLALAQMQGLDPGLLHRVCVIAAGTLDSLPHNGAVVSLLAVCGCTHSESYLDIFMVAVAGPLLALAVVIVLGGWVGSF